MTRGGLVLDPEVAREAMREQSEPEAHGRSANPYDSLTDREKQVLKLVAEGHSNKEVAETLQSWLRDSASGHFSRISTLMAATSPAALRSSW